MALPVPEYISIDEATTSCNPPVTLDRMKWFVSEGHLKAFLPLSPLVSNYPTMYSIPSEEMSDMMQVAGVLRWCGDILLYGEVIIFDKCCNEVLREGRGETVIDRVKVKTADVKRLGNDDAEQAILGDARTVKETEQELCDRLKLAGMEDRVIAQELQRVFPGIKPSRIGRMLPANPGATVGNDAHRKRGGRLLK